MYKLIQLSDSRPENIWTFQELDEALRHIGNLVAQNPDLPDDAYQLIRAEDLPIKISREPMVQLAQPELPKVTEVTPPAPIETFVKRIPGRSAKRNGKADAPWGLTKAGVPKKRPGRKVNSERATA